MVDVGSQFLTLVVTPGEERLEVGDGVATFTTKLTLGGKPLGPAGQEAMRQLNRLEEPFVFTWEKKSFLPASWRLVRVDNPSLPDDLYGYRPATSAGRCGGSEWPYQMSDQEDQRNEPRGFSPSWLARSPVCQAGVSGSSR